MAHSERRFRRLETRLTDRSRLVLHTQQWLDYWTVRLDKLTNGEPVDEKMHVEFLDALIARADASGDREFISGEDLHEGWKT
jgi:hypothetical protein